MKRLMILFLIMISPMIITAGEINAGKMTLNTDMPGRYFSQGKHVAEGDTASVNFYTDISLMIGVKKGDEINIISGLGNEKAGYFSEWNLPKSTKTIKHTYVFGQKATLVESNYDDQRLFPGHKSSGINVREYAYELENLPVLVMKYVITALDDFELVSIGLWSDFDVPEGNKDNNAHNDIIKVLSNNKTIAMLNGENLDTKYIPSVSVLSENSFNYHVMGSLSKALNDDELWEKLSSGSKQIEFNGSNDYRFLIHSEPAAVAIRDSLVFTLALMQGKKLIDIEDMLDKLDLPEPFIAKSTHFDSEPDPALPSKTELLSNYPNPFNNRTHFKINLAEDRFVNVSIFDINGRLVTRLENSMKTVGTYEYSWNGQNLSRQSAVSGIYIIWFMTDNLVQTQKIIMIK